MNLISVIPDTICHDNFRINDREISSMLQCIKPDETFCNFDDVFSVQGRDSKLHQSCFLHVVTETVYHYPHNSFGEKTWKPIVNLRPFVLVSVPGALAELKSHGFQTFSQWWDESYDDIIDPVLRMRAIVGVIAQASDYSLEKIRTIHREMTPVLEFNYNHYYTDFRDQALIDFRNQCQKNLMPR